MAEIMVNHADTNGETVVPPEHRIKLQWRQTTNDIIINIMAENVRLDDVDVEFRPERIRVKFLLPEGEKYDRTFNFYQKINRRSVAMKVLANKIEFRLRKFEDGVNWNHLEAGYPDEVVPETIGEFLE